MNFVDAQARNRQRSIWLIGLLTLVLAGVAWAFNIWLTESFQPLFGPQGAAHGCGGGFFSTDYGDAALNRNLQGTGATGCGGELPAILTPAGTITAAVSVSIALASFSYFWGDRATLFVSGARPVNPLNPRERQFVNVAEEMAIAAGLPAPSLWILPDPDLNAFATGRDPSRSAIAVTEGLLEQLNRDELQAVVAHEMGHIRNRDTLLLLFVTCMVGVILLLTEMMMRGTRYRRWSFRSREGGKGVLLMLLAAVVAWVAGRFFARVAAMAVSREREYLADATSAELTRNPSALASALDKISRSVQPTLLAHPATAPLFIADPRAHPLNEKESRFADLLSTHPPVSIRIRRLEAMAFANLKRDRREKGLDPLTGH